MKKGWGLSWVFTNWVKFFDFGFSGGGFRVYEREKKEEGMSSIEW